MMRILLWAGMLVLAISCSSKKQVPDKKQVAEVVKLSPNDFDAKLISMPNAQLVDVRTPEEYESGYIKGAVNINYQGQNFTAEVAQLDKSKPVFVYCRSGGRSSESAKYMANQGFKEIYDLEGGINNWLHNYKPVEKVTH